MSAIENSNNPQMWNWTLSHNKILYSKPLKNARFWITN
jgi:hypothetical protein